MLFGYICITATLSSFGGIPMKITCLYCGQQIDFDSKFCRFCGEKVRPDTLENGSLDKSLNDIFNAVYTTLVSHSDYSQEEFDKKFDIYKHYEKRVLIDEQYFRLLVEIIFYSGFRASTVNKYLDRIHLHFPSIEAVCKYSQLDIDRICKDPLMIKNRLKIEACVSNAKRMKSLINKHCSIAGFVSSFGDMDDDEQLFTFKEALEKNFRFLGGRTAYHFMMDIGLNVLKPDRVILRVFSRLNLISDENDLKGAVRTGRAFSGATEFPIRYIDVIFVLYGQMNQENITSICTEKNPKCNICEASRFCKYSEMSV